METRKILAILVLRSELLRRVALVLALGLLVWLAGSASAAEMGTAITYQGRLIDANTTADGLYDFAFKLYDTNVGGSKAANDVNVADVDVIDGYFTVELDFNSPSAFNGEARWLEIGVRPGEMNDPNAYTTLSPRQEITPTPYALQTRGIFVDNDGNVGIGTRHPSKLLHIVNKDGGYDGLGICLDPHGFGFTGGTTWHIDNDNDFKLTESRALPGYPRTRFTISDGNIGIGTTNPGTKLHVYEPSSSDVYMSVEASSSDGEAGIRLINPAGGWDVFANNDDGDFGIAHALSDRVLTMKKTTGNVGIGTTSPGAKLQVGDTSVGHDVYIAGSTSSQSGLFFYDGAIPGGMRYNFSSDDLSIFTAGTTNLMIDSSGKVGIGTTSPGAKLQVGDTSAGHDVYIAGSTSSESGLFFYDGGIPGGMRYNFSTDDLSIFTAGTARLMINSSGDVGIGTMNPDAKLDVDGSLVLENGSAINEFSTDGTLSDNSDSTVPTEQAVKTYVDSQAGSGGVGVVPVGGVTAWMKSYPNTPSLPDGWVECNGQTLSDSNSPYDGQVIPDLNGDSGGTQRFLRGSTTSGTTGGSETHSHTLNSDRLTANGDQHAAFHGPTRPIPTSTESSLPSYYEVVWILRVK